MAEIAETIDYKGYEIEICYDSDPQNPYEDWGMFGTLYHWHRRGFIGEDYAHKQEALKELLETDYEDGLIVKVFLYEHSGQRISDTPFSCPWDSGQVGFWCATKEEIDKEFNGDFTKAKACIISQINTLDDYLSGNVYGFRIKFSDEEVDSCWGFYGDIWEYDEPKTEGERLRNRGEKKDGHIIQEAKSVVDYLVNKEMPLTAGADPNVGG